MVKRAIFAGFQEDGPTTFFALYTRACIAFRDPAAGFPIRNPASGEDPVPFGLCKSPINSRPTDRTFIFHLRQVCCRPCLGQNVRPLRNQTKAFENWLEESFEADGINLTAIDLVCNLRVERYKYLQMCGDIAKHSLPRLSINMRHLKNLIEEAGHEITDQQSYLAIPIFSTGSSTTLSCIAPVG